MRVLQKLLQIAKSELSPADAFFYVLDEIRERLGGVPSLHTYRLRDGSTVSLRPGSTDRKVFEEVFIDRIYEPFANLVKGKPSVLVDLGANVGLSALFLERRLHFRRVIVVEPDLENMRALLRNLNDNLSTPCEWVRAFAGAHRGFARMLDSGFGAWGLRMGDSAESGIPVLPLSEIVPKFAGDVVLKCDIEGAERFIFPQIAAWDDQVSFVILELHTEFFTMDQLRQSLAASHYEWRLHGGAEPGAVLAVFALERGARKLQSERDPRNLTRRAATV